MLYKAQYGKYLAEIAQELREVKPDINFSGFISSVKNRYFTELQVLRKYGQGKKVIEIGATPFVFSILAKKFEVDLISVDLNPDKYQEIIDYYGLDVRRVDIESQPLPFEDNSVDYIHFSEVFEHLRINPFFALKEIKRVLKPEGLLFLSTPNFYAADNLWRCIRGKGFRDGFKEFLMIEKFGYPGHIREYTKYEVTEFLEYIGFEIIEHKYRTYVKARFALANLVYKLIPFFRPYQTFLCTKLLKDSTNDNRRNS